MTPTLDLAAALRAHARGLHHLEATAELLIGHATWLHRRDFLHTFVHTAPTPAGTPMAVINWPGAVAALDRGGLPCSSGESRILRLAASLADGIPVDLHDALTGLDADNAELVSHAIDHATGRR
jgi:hypothetical protein